MYIALDYGRVPFRIWFLSNRIYGYIKLWHYHVLHHAAHLIFRLLQQITIDYISSIRYSLSQQKLIRYTWVIVILGFSYFIKKCNNGMWVLKTICKSVDVCVIYITGMLICTFLSRPKAIAAAVGSLMIRRTLSPEMVAASLVAWRWESLK